ncbi:MAG: LysR family transcriptional regulator [Oscillospiraceae bacterium]
MLLKELRYVLAIHTYGTMAKASQHLYISQPALSKYIQNLEDTLNVELFHRNNGRLSLTFAGEKYIFAATKMLEIFEHLECELTDVQNAAKGRIRLGISTFRGPYLLPKVISKFHNSYPQVDLSVSEESAENLEQMLSRGELDLAILNIPLTMPNLDYIPILDEEILLAIPPDHPKSDYGIINEGHRYPWIDLKHFENDSYILLKPSFKTRQITNAVLNTINFAPKSIIETGNINTAYRLAANGYGVSFIPETYVHNSSSSVKANVYSFGKPETRITLAAVYRKDAYLSKACQIFLDMIEEFYKYGGEKVFPENV